MIQWHVQENTDQINHTQVWLMNMYICTTRLKNIKQKRQTYSFDEDALQQFLENWFKGNILLVLFLCRGRNGRRGRGKLLRYIGATLLRAQRTNMHICDRMDEEHRNHTQTHQLQHFIERFSDSASQHVRSPLFLLCICMNTPAVVYVHRDINRKASTHKETRDVRRSTFDSPLPLKQLHRSFPQLPAVFLRFSQRIHAALSLSVEAFRIKRCSVYSSLYTPAQKHRQVCS